MFDVYRGKKYSTKWEGYFILLPGLANSAGSKYIDSIPVDDDDTLVNTVVTIEFTDNSVLVKYAGHNHELLYTQLDDNFELRLTKLIGSHSLEEVIV